MILDRAIEKDRTYRFRMERENNRVRFSIDGERIIDFSDPAVLAGPEHQAFGFENSSSNRIEIGRLTVWRQALPEKISPLEVAASYFQNGQYGEALPRYRYVEEQHRGSSLEPVARYKAGLCLVRLGRVDEADSALQAFETGFPRHELVPFAVFDRAKILEGRGRPAAADSLYRRLGKRHPGHSVLRTAYMRISERLRLRVLGGSPTLEAIEEGRQEIIRWALAFDLPLAENAYLKRAADTLVAGGETRLVLDRYREQHGAVSTALLREGRPNEVVERYPDQRANCVAALFALGREEEVVRNFPEYPWDQVKALWRLGMPEEVLTRFGHLGEYAAVTLVGMGRYEEALERFAGQWEAPKALMGLGRFDQVLRDYGDQSEACAAALRALGRYDEAPERCPDVGTVVRTLLELGRADEVLIARAGDSAACATALIAMGRGSEVVANYGAFPDKIASALLDAGEYERVVAEYRPSLNFSFYEALWRLGRFKEIVDLSPVEGLWRPRALAAMGKFEEARRSVHAGNRTRYADLLVRTGRFADVLRWYRDCRGPAAEALLKVGRYDEVLRSYPDCSLEESAARALMAIDLWKSGERARARELYRARRQISWADRTIGLDILPAALERVGGERVDFRTAYRDMLRRYKYGRALRPWHWAAYMTGMIGDSAFLAQPRRDLADSELLFLRGLKADCDGRPEDALSGYRAYAGLPEWRKFSALVPCDSLALWRMQVLGLATGM